MVQKLGSEHKDGIVMCKFLNTPMGIGHILIENFELMNMQTGQAMAMILIVMEVFQLTIYLLSVEVVMT